MKYCKRWFAFILLATIVVACSDSHITATVTNVPTTTTSTITPPPPAATITPTATAIPLAWKRISGGQEFTRDKIIALAIDPKDPNMLYINMENAGFYQSIDGGS